MYIILLSSMSALHKKCITAKQFRLHIIIYTYKDLFLQMIINCINFLVFKTCFYLYSFAYTWTTSRKQMAKVSTPIIIVITTIIMIM